MFVGHNFSPRFLSVRRKLYRDGPPSQYSNIFSKIPRPRLIQERSTTKRRKDKWISFLDAAPKSWSVGSWGKPDLHGHPGKQGPGNLRYIKQEVTWRDYNPCDSDRSRRKEGNFFSSCFQKNFQRSKEPGAAANAYKINEHHTSQRRAATLSISHVCPTSGQGQERSTVL